MTRWLAQVYLDQIGGEPRAGRMEITHAIIAGHDRGRCFPERPASPTLTIPVARGVADQLAPKIPANAQPRPAGRACSTVQA